MKVLVQPRPNAAHVEVDVEILWDDISQEDIKFLAQQLLIHNLQAKIRAGFYDGLGIPGVITIRAEWEVHRDCVGVKDYKIPENWKSGLDKPAKAPKKAKPAATLEELLQELSPAELKALLA